MNKNILIKIIIAAVVILILGGVFYYWILFPNQKDSHKCLFNQGYSWCDFKNKCVKEGEEDCSLTQDWILSEAKKIIGLDLNVIPKETVKWNTREEEVAFSAKGIYYLDVLRAEKILKGFEDWDKFLNETGFEIDLYNPAVTDGKEMILNYTKGKIACVLSKVDNPNDTSSLSLFCGNPDDRLYNFKSDFGKGCNVDTDCGLIPDGCRKIIVCRSKNYEFYQDCANPTVKVSELDVDINSCECFDNQCVPKNEKFRSKN
ncbi:hypothetical protein IH779_01800 [Patescibacteria group bacterium]|nr:hypothetical protein [Patescibacteria group bacterium]